MASTAHYSPTTFFGQFQDLLMFSSYEEETDDEGRILNCSQPRRAALPKTLGT